MSFLYHFLVTFAESVLNVPATRTRKKSGLFDVTNGSDIPLVTTPDFFC